MSKLTSVYDSNELNLKGDINITLTLLERNMICNALAILLPKETNPMPLIMLVDRIVKGD